MVFGAQVDLEGVVGFDEEGVKILEGHAGLFPQVSQRFPDLMSPPMAPMKNSWSSVSSERGLLSSDSGPIF